MPLSTRPFGRSETPIRAFDELRNKHSQNVPVSWPQAFDELQNKRSQNVRVSWPVGYVSKNDEKKEFGP